MTAIQIIDFMQTNRQIFAMYFLIGTIMPIGVVFAAYIFRGFRMEIRYAAMATSLIGVFMLFAFTMATQNVFFSQVNSLAQLAVGGSALAKNAIMAMGLTLGSEITPPLWMSALSIAQVLLNLGLTVYLFAFAKWEK